MIKKLFSHTIIYGMAPQIPKIASIFILPVITKDLTSRDYGIAGVIEAYMGAFGALSHLGLTVILTNYFYKTPNHFKKFWKEVHGLLTIWSFVYSFLVAISLYFIVSSKTKENSLIIILLNCLPTLLFNTTILFGNFYYQLRQRPVMVGLVSALSGLTAVSMNLYTISYLKLGYLGWFISSATGSFVAFILYVYPVYFEHKLLPYFNFKIVRIKKYLSVSLPTIPHFYSSYILDSADRVILDLNKININSLGLYNVGYNFGNYIRFAVMAINQAVSPFYMRFYAKGTEESKQAARNLTFLLQGGVLLICSVLALWLKEIFQLLIKNSELQMGYTIGILIVMAYSYRPMYVGAVNRLYYHEKTRQLWKISFVGGMINVLLNIIFIPKYGIYAAAVTTLLSLLYLGFSTYFLTVYKDLKDLSYHPIKWIMLILFMTLLVFLLKDVAIALKVIITSLLLVVYYFPFIKLYKFLNKEGI